MVSITTRVVEEAGPSHAGGPTASSSPPDNLSKLLAAFEMRFEKEYGSKVPSHQLKAVTQDESIKAAIEENITTLLEAGGTFEGWVDCEYARMNRNIGKEYRAPKMEYFGNPKSFDEYHNQLQSQRLLKKMNPFSDYLSLEELRQCLSTAPEDDLTLIRYQVMLRAYANSKSQSEVSAALEMLPSYAHFFELGPKVFLYVGIKCVSFMGHRSKLVHELAARFSDESGDTNLISLLKDKQLKELVSTAREHLQKH